MRSLRLVRNESVRRKNFKISLAHNGFLALGYALKYDIIKSKIIKVDSVIGNYNLHRNNKNWTTVLLFIDFYISYQCENCNWRWQIWMRKWEKYQRATCGSLNCNKANEEEFKEIRNCWMKEGEIYWILVSEVAYLARIRYCYVIIFFSIRVEFDLRMYLSGIWLWYILFQMWISENNDFKFANWMYDHEIVLSDALGA